MYFHDVPLSLLLRNQRHPDNLSRYNSIVQFHADARGKAADFPEFSFIEPCYQLGHQNDDHPPHDIMRGQVLIADIYNSLRANEELWNATLFVILYDEHGGFYDHVTPPKVVPPDRFQDKFSFKQYGVRVPALLVSPWVEADFLDTEFDHASLLKYLIDKWGLGNLGNRARFARTFAGAIGKSKKPRTDTPERIELELEHLFPSDIALDRHAVGYESDHHTAIDAFMYALQFAPEGKYIVPILNSARSMGVPDKVLIEKIRKQWQT